MVERAKKYSIEEIGKLPNLLPVEKDFAEVYGRYIDFTHHSEFRFKKTDPHLRRRFEQLKTKLEEAGRNLDNPNQEMELMLDVEILFDTHGVQIVRRQWP